MTRSAHNGCGGPRGVCRPHKKWRGNSASWVTRKTVQERRAAEDEAALAASYAEAEARYVAACERDARDAAFSDE